MTTSFDAVFIADSSSERRGSEHGVSCHERSSKDVEVRRLLCGQRQQYTNEEYKRYKAKERMGA